MKVPDLSFYAAVNRLILPKSYVGKFLVVAFVLIHLPLFALIIYLLGHGGFNDVRLIAVMVLATVAGAAAAMTAFYHLLAPMLRAKQALNAYLERGIPDKLPLEFEDEAGQLLRDVDKVISTFDTMRQKLLENAEYDHLTRLFNRMKAEILLNLRFREEERRAPSAVCVALIDIDHFKEINDRYGHEFGDETLIVLGKCLQSSLRDRDWAARWGGDEFLVVMESDEAGALAALERIYESVRQTPVQFGGWSVPFTISAGLVTIAPGEKWVEGLRRADGAIYRAKDEGRDRIVVEA